MAEKNRKRAAASGKNADDLRRQSSPYVSSFEQQLRSGATGETPREEPREQVPDKELERRHAQRRRERRIRRRRRLIPKGFNSGSIDIPFLLLLLAVAVIGLIMLFSASYAAAYYKYSDPYHFILHQLLYTGVGLVLMYFVSRIPYQILHGLALPILLVTGILLILVLFVGTDNNTEATRWLDIGLFTFQPSEVAKAAIIIFFASYAVRMRDTIRSPKALLPFLVLLGLTAALMLKQPHLSATIIIIISGIVVLFLGGAHIPSLIGLACTGIVGVYILVFKIGYQYARIASWRDPFSYQQGEGFQILQSLYAVASGGLWGRGLGQSIQKQMYLPEPYNDFIFAIVCEELGFIGSALIILLFAALYIRGYYIALKSRDTFGTLLVAGFITQLAIQTLLNIGVVTQLLPVTGASLPFFSSGGTSLVVLYLEMGVVLSVSRQMSGNRKT